MQRHLHLVETEPLAEESIVRDLARAVFIEPPDISETQAKKRRNRIRALTEAICPSQELAGPGSETMGEYQRRIMES